VFSKVELMGLNQFLVKAILSKIIFKIAFDFCGAEDSFAFL